jgi:nucleotide-binding universal stress UspA family protein
MVYLVPFDGSPLARSALRRASTFAEHQRVVAFAVVPTGSKYARSKGWLDAGESFDADAVETHLRESVTDVAPDADFESVRVESRPPGSTVAKHIRQKARELDAEIVFLGSDNAGKIVTPVSSVGTGVTSDESYDIYIARHRIGD